MSTVSEFKEFILRGNVVDLAVGVVIGAAFGGIVKAFTEGIITPLIGLPGSHDLSGLTFPIRNQMFKVGDVLNAIVNFLIVAAVLFFLVVKPLNHLQTLQKKAAEPDAAPALTRDQELLTEIRDTLRVRS